MLVLGQISLTIYLVCLPTIPNQQGVGGLQSISKSDITDNCDEVDLQDCSSAEMDCISGSLVRVASATLSRASLHVPGDLVLHMSQACPPVGAWMLSCTFLDIKLYIPGH